jgi:hypothetical protein
MTLADGNVIRRSVPGETENSQGLLHWTVLFVSEIMYCIYCFYNSLQSCTNLYVLLTEESKFT